MTIGPEFFQIVLFHQVQVGKQVCKEAHGLLHWQLWRSPQEEEEEGPNEEEGNDGCQEEDDDDEGDPSVGVEHGAEGLRDGTSWSLGGAL